MNIQSIQEFVYELASAWSNAPETTYNENTTVDSLGLDSLDKIEMIMEIEGRLNIDVPDDMIENITTLGDIIRVIEIQNKETT